MTRSDKPTPENKHAAAGAAPGHGPHRPRRWRRWVARLLSAVLAPVLFLLLVELGLRLFGYGYDASYFVDAGQGGLCRSNMKFARRFFPPELIRDPVPEVFPRAKPRGMCRIFVLGSSAAQGVPDMAFSFGRILEVMLREAFPSGRFEVINTGMTAINSHVVLPIARDCAKLQPDLFIVYMGHNEVVGPYGKGGVFGGAGMTPDLIRASIFLRGTRIGQLLSDTLGLFRVGGTSEARKWAGMEMFLGSRVPADDPWLPTAYGSFRANLRDICAAARSAGAQTVLVTPLTNLRNCSPFASLHQPALTAGQQRRWDDLLARGGELEGRGQWQAALALYDEARRIDDGFAELHFRMGQCHLALGQIEPARKHLIRARDLDVLRFRADTHLQQAIREVAAERAAQGVHLVDAERLAWADANSPLSLPGSELLYEHVHLTFEGNCWLAAAVFRAVAGLLPPEVRGGVPAGAPPPSPQRCAELLPFTASDRLAAAIGIALLTERPPFPKDQGARNRATAQRLEAQLSPDIAERLAGQYEDALRRRPEDLLTRACYTRLLAGMGRPAAVAEQCRLLLDRYPGYRSWSVMLGTALAQEGKLDEAVAQFRAVLRDDPHALPARTGLADALLRAGRADEAIAEFRQFLSYSPDEPRGHVRLGRVLLGLNRPEEAVPCFQTAVRLAPQEAEFHFHLAVSLERTGRTEAAVQSYRRAIELMPTAIPALQALSMILSTHPDAAIRNGPEAVALAERACRAAPAPSPDLLDALACACAEAGHFDRAVASAGEALALAQRAGRGDLADAIRGRLALYAQGKPARRPPGLPPASPAPGG